MKPPIALITGSTHGIGRATADALLAQGWSVTGIDREASDLRHPNYQHVELDLCSPEVDRAFARVYQTLQPELTVHSAGIGIMQAFWASSREADQRLVALNVGATYAITKVFAAEAMNRPTPQHLILLSSLAGLSATPGMALYAASKHFVSGLAKSVHAELAVDAPWARVSSLAPPPVRTQFRQHSGRAARSKRIRGVLEVDVVVRELLLLHRRPRLDRIPGRLHRWIFTYIRPLIPSRMLLRRVYLSAKSD